MDQGCKEDTGRCEAKGIEGNIQTRDGDTQRYRMCVWCAVWMVGHVM